MSSDKSPNSSPSADEATAGWLSDRLFGWAGIVIAGIVSILVLFVLYRVTSLVNYDLLVTIYPRFLDALWLVAKVVVISGILSVIGGVLVGLGRVSKVKFTRTVASCYVEFFRGTPLLFQLMVIFVGIPQLFWEPGGFPIQDWGIPAAIIGLTLNHSAYIGEAIKGGINAVPEGQMEAARSLGLSYIQSMRKIIIPQAFKNALAAIGNDQVILIKDTSLLTVLAIPEIISVFREVNSKHFDPWTPILLAAVAYLMLTIPLGILVRKLEDLSQVGGEENL